MRKCFFAAFILLSGFSPKSFAQSDILSALQTDFTNYTKRTSDENVFVHTDKSFYVAGEIIWFKVYVTEANTDESKVAYVELLDRNNLTVLNAKIALTNRSGNGSFQLPLGTSSDNYLLRAYTRQMHNNGPDGFFQKRIAIVNPFKHMEPLADRAAASYSIHFFPEGGNMVRELASKVGFELLDKNGKGINGKGVIVNEKNDTITSFSSLQFGMGSFDFVPQTNHSYKALVSFEDGATLIKSLPEALLQGYTMIVEEMNNDQLRLTVSSNVHSSYPEVFLVTHTKNKITNSKRTVISNNIGLFTIDKSSLSEGVNVFTIFDNEKRPVGERLFFVQPAIKSKVTIQLNKPQFSSREKVAVSVLPKDSTDLLDMSMAVYHLDSLQAANAEENIIYYSWLSSNISGTIEKPSYYFSDTSLEVRKATDNLMLTHGWRRFKWE